MQVVGAIIRNNNGEFLLQQRDDRAPSFRRCWTLFGGLVEPGESPIEAILRELREEIALDLSTVTGVTLFRIYEQEVKVTQVIYSVWTDAGIDDLNLREGRAMRYVSPDEARKLHYAFNIEQVLEDFIASHLEYAQETA